MTFMIHNAVPYFTVKALLILYCMSVVVSCSTQISISVLTTSLRHCNEVNLWCSVCVEL